MTREHTLPRPRRLHRRPVTAALVVAAVVGGAALVAHERAPARAEPADAAGPAAPATCAPAASPEPPPRTPTTPQVVEQAYDCILDRYRGSTPPDGRQLLTAAFAAVTRRLDRERIDGPWAASPVLTGDRTADRESFAAAFRRVLEHVPAVPRLRTALAADAVDAMVTSLRDDHAAWVRAGATSVPDYVPGSRFGLGFTVSVDASQARDDPGSAVAPLVVLAVTGGPAKAAGLRPGDVVEAIDGAAPFVDGTLDALVRARLDPSPGDTRPVALRLRRPGTSRPWTVTLTPATYAPDAAATRLVTSRLLPGDVVYVALRGFPDASADQVVAAVSALSAGRTLRGLVLDLRGNHGGLPDEADRLLGAFVHGAVTAYWCTGHGACEARRTDDAVPLLRLPLAVLTDRGCASACDHVAAAVRDLGLGHLVGTRTAGAVSGPAQPYLLGDGTLLVLPVKQHLGLRGEPVDGVGVPPDVQAPLTAADLSAGRDPAVSRALSLLSG